MARLLEDVVPLGDEQRVPSEHSDVGVGLERAKVLRNACKRGGMSRNFSP